MGSQDEVLRELKKKRRGIWLLIVVSVLFSVLGFIGKEILIIVFGLLLLALGVIGLRNLNGFGQNLADYHPGQGFRYFRKTKEGKLKECTLGQYVMAGIVLLFVIFRFAIGQALACGIGVILFIQFYLKRRINLHTKIDYASLFELEEIGIITSKDSVTAVYKDFESWNQVQKGSKILLVTQDSLVCVIMESREDAVRMECRLKDIRKLGVMGHGKQGEGLLVSIGTLDNRMIRIKLEGASFQDSPEEFFKYFLQALDEALTLTPQPIKERSRTVELKKREIASQTVIAVNNEFKPRINIQKSDFFDQNPSTMDNTHSIPSNERSLDI